MGILETILATKRGELDALRRRPLPKGLAPRPIVLQRAPGERLRLIAEIKLRSPSAGPLSRVASVSERARAYAEAGADMISVLCDTPYFDGAYEHLTQARTACNLPLLCKEFIIDTRQLDAAVAYGADAVLLIVRCLDASALRTLIEASVQRGLTPLVEVHTQDEAQLALDAGARWIGVNARDLDTLAMDGERAAAILHGLPQAITAVHLSGLKAPADVSALWGGRADAALIGEALMRQDDPRSLLGALVSAATPRAASPAP